MQCITLRQYLLYANISTEQACELFGRKERTLWNWNKHPPQWVLNIIKLYISRNPMPTKWHGWTFEKDLIIDPDGNKYHQNEIRAIYMTRQLTESLTGNQTQILSFKDELQKRLDVKKSFITVTVGNDSEVIKQMRIEL